MIPKRKPKPPSNDPQRPPKGPGSGAYSKPEPKVIIVKNEENA